MKKLILSILIITSLMFMVLGSVSATITSITVDAPEGGDYWSGTRNVEWIADGEEGDFVDIFLYNGGQEAIKLYREYNGVPYPLDTTTHDDGDSYYIFVRASNPSNWGTNDVSGIFTIDNAEPTASVVINGGEEYTTSQEVTLTLTFGDETSGVKECRYANEDLSWTNWDDCVNEKQWTLTNEDGEKTAYYEVKDNAENVKQASDTIKLDTTEPTVDLTPDSPTNPTVYENAMEIVLTCQDDNGCGKIGYDLSETCSNNVNDYTVTTGSSTSFNISSPTNICTYAKDNVGNEYFSIDPVYYDNIYTSIQDAITDAEGGETINVAPGTYDENILIDNSLNLIGAGAETTIIQSSTGEKLVYIIGSETDVELTGFTLRHTDITGWSTSYAILVENGAYANIHDNVVDDYKKRGIYIMGSETSADIVGNIVMGGAGVDGLQNGIVVWSSSAGFVNIVGNEVFGGNYLDEDWTATGIMALDTYDKAVVIKDNDIHDNQAGIVVGDYCGYFDSESYSADVTIRNNILIDNAWGIDIVNDMRDAIIEDNKISGSTGYAIGVTDYEDSSWTTACQQPTNTQIHHNNIVGNSFGLEVNDRVATVNAENNWWGDITGPYHDDTNLDGQGNKVSDNVGYRPWWISPTGGNDNENPSSQITFSQTIQYVNTLTFDIPFSALDNYGLNKVDLYQNGVLKISQNIVGYISSYLGTFPNTVISDGTYEYYTRAVDVVDNEEEIPLSANATVIVDTANPDVTIDSVTTPTKVVTQIITGIFTELNLDKIEVNSVMAVIGEDTYSATIPLVEGLNTVTVIATDLAGNTKEASSMILLDTTKPIITDVTGEVSIVVSEDVEICATVTDSGSSVDSVILHYDSEDLPMMEGTNDQYCAIILNLEKDVEYYITAIDIVGNDETSSTYTIEVFDFIIELQPGWTLISIPVVPSSIEMGEVSQVYAYDPLNPNADANGWLLSIDGVGSLGDMTAGYGYWVYTDTATVIKGHGKLISEPNGMPTIPPSRTLVSGWNLIGHYGLNAQLIEDALYSLVNKGSESKTWSAIYPSDSGNMESGQGYWLAIDGSLTVYTPNI